MAGRTAAGAGHAEHDRMDGGGGLPRAAALLRRRRSQRGTAINIVHRAPTGVGATVKSEAVLESFDGRFYTFRVSAHNGTEVIGYGTIARAIVSKAKFEEKQRAKQAPGG